MTVSSRYTVNWYYRETSFPIPKDFHKTVAIGSFINGSHPYDPCINILNPRQNQTVYIDVTLKDFCAYEGAFVNPPYKSSLDVQPNNVFQVANDTNKSQCSSVTLYHTGWYRLVKMPRFFTTIHYTSGSTKDVLCFKQVPIAYFDYMGGYVGNAPSDCYESYRIKFASCLHVWIYSTHRDTLLLEVTGQFWSPRITKFRLARSVNPVGSYMDSTVNYRRWYYDAYIEAYNISNHNSSPSNTYFIGSVWSYPGFTNGSGNPDGDNDVLIGSEVTPTLEGTHVSPPIEVTPS